MVKTIGRTYYLIGLEIELEVTEIGKNEGVHTYKFFLIAIQPSRIHSNTALALSCLRTYFQIMEAKKSSFKCTLNYNSSKLIHHNSNVWGNFFKRNGEGRRKENDSLHKAFLRACWFWNTSHGKKSRDAHLFTATGHSPLTKGSVSRRTLWFGMLC